MKSKCDHSYHDGQAAMRVHYLLRQAAFIAYGRQPGFDDFFRYVGQQLPVWFRTFRKRVLALLTEVRKARAQGERPLSTLISHQGPAKAVWAAYVTLFPKDAAEAKALPTYITWIDLALQADRAPTLEERTRFRQLPALIEQGKFVLSNFAEPSF